METKIEKIIDDNNVNFQKICEWQYNWWGKENDYDKKKVLEWMGRCLNNHYLPQTYTVLNDGIAIGMFQLVMDDDIDIRPDYYPWLANVYIDEKYRGQGLLTNLINHMKYVCNEMGIKKIYLHTKHKNLYEKYGWKYLEEVTNFDGLKKSIYYLDLNKE
jgi:GNAT superfamily N-acetyltransferase